MFSYPARHGRHAHGRHGFAVVDLETTGFRADGPDRIVEIAIVRMDREGVETGRFESLIDPARPMAAQQIHHIDDRMVTHAPTFAEIAPTVLAWLRGSVVVAHNASFEDAFLSAEFARAGWNLPRIPALDTLRLAQERLSCTNHRLATVCAWAGIAIDGAHTAAGDAGATARLLPHLLAEPGPAPLWNDPMPGLGGHVAGRYLPRPHPLSA